MKRIEQSKTPAAAGQQAAYLKETPAHAAADGPESRILLLQRDTDELINEHGLDASLFSEFRSDDARLEPEEGKSTDTSKEMSRIFASVGSIVAGRVFGARSARVKEIVDETREAIMQQTANIIGTFQREE